MALQNCPNCNEESFNWSVDEENSSLTRWACECGYEAYKEESFERKCSSFQNETESKLKDDEKEYWWHSSCIRVELIVS